MQTYFSSNRAGFTLIEIIVSLALFSVVITIAVGALLILIASNRQLQNEQSVLSNLSFALDSMTREIRTGSNYFCHSSGNTSASLGGENRRIFTDNRPLDIAVVRDCPFGDDENLIYHGIAFDEGGDSITVGNSSTRIAYFYNRAEGKLYRRLSGLPSESIVSDGIYISDVDFFVTGSSRTDGLQPRISIVIKAYASEDDFLSDTAGDRAYVIQTTVTQRALDI